MTLELGTPVDVNKALDYLEMVQRSNDAYRASKFRYRLTKRDLMKVLRKMPDGAAIWNGAEGQSEEDAGVAIMHALWKVAKPAMKKMVLTVEGQYVEEGK